MTQRFGLSPAEQQLFDVGLAQDEQAAFGVRPSAYAQLRQQPRPAPLPRKVAPARARPMAPAPRVAPSAASPRGIGATVPGVADSFEEEAQLRQRNRALRRAFSAVPGGPEALAAIDGLVEGSMGSPRGRRTFKRSADRAPAAKMLKAVQREVDRALSAQDPRERKSLIEETVRKLPMGEEAFQSFSRERELTERNNRVRSAIGLPRTAVSPSSTSLSADAEARLWDETLAHEETLGGNRPSTYARLRDEERVWNDGLAQDGRAAAPRTTRVTPRSAADEDRDFIEAEKEQARLHERNQARRRAYGAIEGGDAALARVDAIVAASRAPLPAPGGGVGGGVSSVLSPEVEEQLFAGMFANEEPVPALAEAQRILAAETAAEREALTMELASKIPGGVESVLSFRAEAEQAERNAARRREMLADPGGLAALDAEDAYIEAAQRGLQYVVPEYGPQAPRLSAADRARLEALRPQPAGPPENLIEIYKRGEFTDADVAALESVPFDVRERARWIAYYEESPKLEDRAKADALRAGGPLPEDVLGGDFVGALGSGFVDGGHAVWDALVRGQELQAENERAQQELIDDTVRAAADTFFEHAVLEPYNAEIRDDELKRELYAAGYEWLGSESAELWSRFESELRELDDLSTADAMERWHQAMLGAIVEGGGQYPLGINPVAMLEGLAGNRTYEGRDHPLFAHLPEGVRDFLGETLDDVTRPEFIVPAALGVGLATVGAPILVSAVLVGATTLLLEDLADDGSPTVRELLGEENPDEAIPEILETLDQLERRLDELDPDGTLRQQLGVR